MCSILFFYPKVSTVTAVVYSANNSTVGINNQISPIQITASQAVAVSSQANQVAQTEKQVIVNNIFISSCD